MPLFEPIQTPAFFHLSLRSRGFEYRMKYLSKRTKRNHSNITCSGTCPRGIRPETLEGVMAMNHESSCRCELNENSIVARLRRLQKKIDAETERVKSEQNLTVPCKEGCSECCSRCFCVSEAEFVLVLHFILNHWTKEEVLQIVSRSKEQWEILNAQNPACAQKLQGEIPLKELLHTDKTILPFPCIFLSGEGSCLIYRVRPLACRINGVAYTSLAFDDKPCPRLPNLFSALDQFVNLTAFAEEIYSFLFLNYGDQVIVRRPAPLFYYFHLIFQDPEMIDKLQEADFYRDMLGLKESDYIKSLVEGK